MPENAYEILRTSLEEQKPLFADDFSAALQYKLLTEYFEGYDKYQDISSDLSDRIRNTLPSFTGLSSFCDLLKSKDMTYTRISRCLFHILLNMTKKEFETCKAEDIFPTPECWAFARMQLLSLPRSKRTAPFHSLPVWQTQDRHFPQMLCVCWIRIFSGIRSTWGIWH